jgi:hypothetical protein
VGATFVVGVVVSESEADAEVASAARWLPRTLVVGVVVVEGTTAEMFGVGVGVIVDGVGVESRSSSDASEVGVFFRGATFG